MQEPMNTRKEAAGQGNGFMPHNSQHERQEAAILVELILDRGYSVSVCDGEDWPLRRSRDKAAILGAMGSTDGDVLRLRDENGDRVADFSLIYGNGPGELVADHTANSYAESLWNAFEARCGL